MKANRMTALLTTEKARDWKTFVAEYVVLKTARQEDRDLAGGYQVKRVDGGYTILFGKADPGYGVMSAELAYSWFARLPLSYFARQADDYRYELLTA